MKITIAEPLRPFSHIAGAACLIPGTCWVIQAFPTLLRIGDKEVKLDFTGPVQGFTLQQDLERHCVFVFGHAKEGYYKLRITASDAGFAIESERGKAFHQHIAADISFVPNRPRERLSLGSHKSQDWDGVQRRCDLKEILPVLFCLGQTIPTLPPQPLQGTARLLELPIDLESFFKAAFTQILVPRLQDDQHQGLVPEEKAKGHPCFLIQEGAKVVRSLFFKQNERRIAFLPQLFDCGRMVGIQAPGIGSIDFEWSKKELRRGVIRASTDGDVILELPKELKTFRVRKHLKEKGYRQKRDEPLLLEKGTTYLLDRFQK